MPTTYEMSVLSPCQGTQTLNEISSTIYTGSTGDFSFVNLLYESAVWKITIYDYRAGSACFGVSTYLQITPDSDPTTSQYGKEDANGDPDPTLGVATVVTP